MSQRVLTQIGGEGGALKQKQLTHLRLEPARLWVMTGWADACSGAKTGTKGDYKKNFKNQYGEPACLSFALTQLKSVY